MRVPGGITLCDSNNQESRRPLAGKECGRECRMGPFGEFPKFARGVRDRVHVDAIRMEAVVLESL